MKKKRNGKIILEYGAGILILAVSILFAWFFPDLYVIWQDQSRLGKTVTSEREEIQFLDVDALDIAGRLWALRNVEYLNFAENAWQASGDDMEIELEAFQILARLRRLVQTWETHGMLPEGSSELLEDRNFGEDAQPWTEGDIRYFTVYTDQTALNVMLAVFYNPDCRVPSLALVADVDKDLLYYVEAAGNAMWDFTAQCIGPEGVRTYEELLERYLNTAYEPEKFRIGDLAAVCGAKSFQVRGKGNNEGTRLYALEFDNFDALAQVGLIMQQDAVCGMDVALGTGAWREFVIEVMLSNGMDAYVMPMEASQLVSHSLAEAYWYMTNGAALTDENAADSEEFPEMKSEMIQF